MLRLMLLLSLTLFASESMAARTVAVDETWSGKISLDADVVVSAGATLTIQPGAQLLFADKVGLFVEGRLLAKGTAAMPIVFRSTVDSENPSWPGISIANGDRSGSELDNVVIKGALQSLTAFGSKVRITSSSLQNGETGIVAGGGAYISVTDVVVRTMSKGGIDASVQTQGEVVGCRLEQVAGFGIQTARQATLSIRNNYISKAKFGIFLNGDSPPLEGNVIEECEVGIALVQVTPNTVLRGNTVMHSKVGIGCHQFSSPLIEGNIIEDCEKGLDCFQAASPVVHQNRFARNRSAIFCVQMCNPMVTSNDFFDNETAVYLHLSSYAQFHGNNFEGNRQHIELDNMSYDWEQRAKNKPTRQRQAQNEKLAQQGRALSTKIQVDVTSEGFVNAQENYWGVETTLEMATGGVNVNVSTIKDGVDVPTLTYEGWPGEYKLDRVNFAGWKKEKITGTGPQPISNR